MTEKEILNKPSFWNLLTFLEAHQGQDIPLKEVGKKLNMADSELVGTVALCQKLGAAAKIEKNPHGLCYLSIPKDELRIFVDLGLKEWLALEAQLFCSSPKNQKAPYFRIINKKVAALAQRANQVHLTKAVETEEKKRRVFPKMTKQQLAIIEKIEEAKSLNSCVQIEFARPEQEVVSLFPRRLVIVDEKLSIIGEDCQLGHLAYFPIESIQKLDLEIYRIHRPKFTSVAVEDFVQDLRDVLDIKELLVIKLKGPQTNPVAPEFSPPFHYFGRPSLSYHQDGDPIWSASVERSQELYRWLYEMQDSLEILASQKIITEFAEFSKKMNNKKIKSA